MKHKFSSSSEEPSGLNSGYGGGQSNGPLPDGGGQGSLLIAAAIAAAIVIQAISSLLQVMQ